LLGTYAFGAPALGSPKGARPSAWPLARSRSRGARLHVASARSGSGFATGARLGQRASTARLIPRSLSLPRRAPPPLWETSRAATRVVTALAS